MNIYCTVTAKLFIQNNKNMHILTVHAQHIHILIIDQRSHKRLQVRISVVKHTNNYSIIIVCTLYPYEY